MYVGSVKLYLFVASVAVQNPVHSYTHPEVALCGWQDVKSQEHANSSVKKKKNLKQSWLPAFWKKIQNTQEIKRMLFNWTKQDKTCKYSR